MNSGVDVARPGAEPPNPPTPTHDTAAGAADQESAPPDPPARSRLVVGLLVAGVALAALNLRTAVTSVGPVLNEITDGVGLSGTGAGLLTMLPVVCFSVGGACAPALIRTFGPHRVLLVALVALTLGLGTRVLVGVPWAFLTLSALALGGAAIGNVLLPTLVKQHFPHRVGLMTTVYSTAMAVGTAVAAAGTVPLMRASGGSWQLALGSYALFGLTALLPWALVLGHEPPRRAAGPALGARRVLRSAMAWQSAVFFGTQATIAYIMFGWFAYLLRDNGMSAAAAGLVLSYVTVLSVPLSLLLPGLVARRRDHRGFVVVFSACYLVGFTGLGVAPVAAAWLWATLIGVGMATFPLALTLFAVRTRTASGTASLSAASQSVGYLIAGTGPLLFGLLHDTSGGWWAPIALLLTVTTINLGAGLLIGRPRDLEDQPALRDRVPAGAGR